MTSLSSLRLPPDATRRFRVSPPRLCTACGDEIPRRHGPAPKLCRDCKHDKGRKSRTRIVRCAAEPRPAPPVQGERARLNAAEREAVRRAFLLLGTPGVACVTYPSGTTQIVVRRSATDVRTYDGASVTAALATAVAANPELVGLPAAA